jgi:hypothetical protein
VGAGAGAGGWAAPGVAEGVGDGVGEGLGVLVGVDERMGVAVRPGASTAHPERRATTRGSATIDERRNAVRRFRVERTDLMADLT